MKEKNTCDYLIIGAVSKDLKQIADNIELNIVQAENDVFDILKSAWNSDASICFAEKYSLINNKIKSTEKKIYTLAERIRKLSRHMYLVEQDLNIEQKSNEDLI